MAPRRASTLGGISTPPSRQRVQAGVRKNTHARQAPNGYSQQPDLPQSTPVTGDSNRSSLSSEEPTASIPQYTHSPPSSEPIHIPHPLDRNSPFILQRTPVPPSETNTHTLSRSPSDMPVSLGTMRELLRLHEQEIIDCVVLQLSSRSENSQIHTPRHPQPAPNPIPGTQPSASNNTLTGIADLESQLAPLRKDSEQDWTAAEQRRARGMYDSFQLPILESGESASAITESIEVLFPGVEHSTLVQIIENQFKPTNIYRLLATEQERAESQRTISFGGIEFEQTERDGKESKYRMSRFFKAWAAYSGILVKLAPYPLQGDLATALSIYTMNL